MQVTQTQTVTIDGQVLEVAPGVTIWEAARSAGIAIPALCHHPKLAPVGVCRMCVVDVGERVLAASCVRTCHDGMTVATSSPKVEQHRRMLTDLLLGEYPEASARNPSAHACELESLGRGYGLSSGNGDNHAPMRGSTPSPAPGIQSAVPGAQSTVTDTQDSGSDTRHTVPGTDLASGAPLERPVHDNSSPVIAVDHAACILCDRCIRACDDLQNNHVIGRSGKGHSARIAFDLNQPMGASTCVSCGECAAACPTDALTHKAITLPILPREATTTTQTVCPYCGVGCATVVSSRDDQIILTEGRESPVNHERLCVKGRYGWDYTRHPQRLTKPLIRRAEAYPKGPLSGDVKGSPGGRNGRKPGGIVDDAEVLPAFREATWEEALELVGRRLREIRDTQGPSALAGFGSAKCSNEEAYLFQKLIRGGLGTNNVDHCTRLCHASSVAALMETIGSGAVTNVFADVANADVCLITGSNATANHPVAATFIKQAVRRGTKLILVDVRRHDLADFATHFAQINSGSDVAFYNAVMHVLIAEEMVDETFIAERTEGVEALKELVLRDFSPEQASPICGIDPEEIRAIARTIGGANRHFPRSQRRFGNALSQPQNRVLNAGVPKQSLGTSGLGMRGQLQAAEPATLNSQPSTLNSRLPRMLIFWGMGIAQHSHGTDNARCLISLCLLTGNVGKPGTGLHPLRGQNNVQGASDAGLIPMVYPDYQSVADSAIRTKFEVAWNRELDPQPGLTVVEIMRAALAGAIRGMYILGENPFISDPNSNKVRKALSALDFLVVQDIFLTETAEFADVILPASSYFEKDGTYTNTDRRVQVGRKVLEPPGEARADWEIICDIARRVGLPMEYASPAEVFDEFAALTTNYAGLSHENLGSTGKLWPCANPHAEDGAQILFGDRFPTANGRGKFVPCVSLPAAELTDGEYPLILTTGRVLEHWHTGSMTRRSRALDAIAPSAFVKAHPDDLLALAIDDRQRVRVSSRRGQIELEVQSDLSIEPGSLFIPFHFREASANLLTNDVLDPDGKIPEFKYCAVRMEAVSAD